MTDYYYGVCGCRIWPLSGFDPLGSCGRCKEVPKPLPKFTAEMYENWKATFLQKWLDAGRV